MQENEIVKVSERLMLLLRGMFCSIVMDADAAEHLTELRTLLARETWDQLLHSVFEHANLQQLTALIAVRDWDVEEAGLLADVLEARAATDGTFKSLHTTVNKLHARLSEQALQGANPAHEDRLADVGTDSKQAVSASTGG